MEFVVCIIRREPWNAGSPIERIGIAASAGATAREHIDVERAAQEIEANVRELVVYREGEAPIPVLARRRQSGTAYLSTLPDGEEPGNLAQLPMCGQESSFMRMLTKQLIEGGDPSGSNAVTHRDLRLDLFEPATIRFERGGQNAYAAYFGPPPMLDTELVRFLAVLRANAALGSTAEQYANSFRDYMLAMHRDVPAISGWGTSMLRVRVLCDELGAEGLPLRSAVAGRVVDENGDLYRGEDLDAPGLRFEWVSYDLTV